MTQSIYHLESITASPEPHQLPSLAPAWGTMTDSISGERANLEIWQYLHIIGQWLWLIILCSLVAGVCSFIVSTYMMTPVYRASTTLMVKASALTNKDVASNHANDYDIFLANQDMTITFKELAQRRPVADAAAQMLGINSDQLYGHIQIAVIPKTPLMVLSFESTVPNRAMTVTNAVAAALIQTTKNLEWMPGRELAVIEKAERPKEPVSPRVWLNILVAAVVGGVLALAGVFVVEYLRFAMYA